MVQARWPKFVGDSLLHAAALCMVIVALPAPRALGQFGACCLPTGGCVDSTTVESCEGYICDVPALSGASCYGDVDANGVVNPGDRGFIAANIGQTDRDLVCLYDVDGNGVINAGDRGFVAANIGLCVALPDFMNGSGCNGGDCPDPRYPTLGGTFRGEGSLCSGVICAAPTGACCFGGSCFEASVATCVGVGGTHFGNGVACDSVDCGPTAGGDTCTDPTGVLPDGMTHTFIEHGGWFTFEADANFTRINTCGSNFDTIVRVFAACGGGVLASNDDCSNSSFGAGSDGSAPCFDPSVSGSEFSSCLCRQTTPGNTYIVQVCVFGCCTVACSLPEGSIVELMITSDSDCSEPTFGACCLDEGACLDATEDECTDLAGVYEGDATNCEETLCP